MKQTEPQARTPPLIAGPRRARAFALPLVVLLSLVAAVLIAAMLDRQGAQRATVARAGDEYRRTHFARGVVEVVDTWMSYQGGKPLHDLLGADGKALDLDLADGSVLSVYFRDAQGALLRDLSGLSPEDRADLKGAMEILAGAVEPARLSQVTRGFGPPSISLRTAPEEVLAAVCRQVAGSTKCDALLSALQEARQKARPTVQDLTQAAVSSDLDDVQRKVLSRLISTDCGFYRLTLDARGPGVGPDSPPIERYGAYALPRSVGGGRVRNTSAGNVQRRTQIVGWERVEIR